MTYLCKPTTKKTVTTKVKRRVHGKPVIVSTKIAITGCAKPKPAKRTKKAGKRSPTFLN